MTSVMRGLRVADSGDYEAHVDDCIVRAIRAGARSFGSLVRQLPSVYPTVALVALRRLTDQGRMSPVLAASMQREAASALDRPIQVIGDGLPLPHPLQTV